MSQCYLLADFSTICMCLIFSDEISHYPLNFSVKQGEMTAMTASPIGLYFEKRTRPICVTPSPGRSDAIHFAPWLICSIVKTANQRPVSGCLSVAGLFSSHLTCVG